MGVRHSKSITWWLLIKRITIEICVSQATSSIGATQLELFQPFWGLRAPQLALSLWKRVARAELPDLGAFGFTIILWLCIAPPRSGIVKGVCPHDLHRPELQSREPLSACYEQLSVISDSRRLRRQGSRSWLS
jgi:hypothetical protein